MNPGEFTLNASYRRIIDAIILIIKNFFVKVDLLCLFVSYACTNQDRKNIAPPMIPINPSILNKMAREFINLMLF